MHERALAVGIFNGGSMIGSIIAPPLLVWLTLSLGWRAAFLLPGLLGFVWVVAWRLFYRSPDEHSLGTVAERSYTREGKEQAEAPAPSNAQLLGLRRS